MADEYGKVCTSVAGDVCVRVDGRDEWHTPAERGDHEAEDWRDRPVIVIGGRRYRVGVGVVRLERPAVPAGA